MSHKLQISLHRTSLATRVIALSAAALLAAPAAAQAQPHQTWGWDALRPVTGDFNGDQVTDIAILRRVGSGSDLQVFLSNKDGLRDPEQWWHGKWGFDALKPIPGDFNGDKVTDLAILRRTGAGSEFQVFFSTRTGLTGPHHWWGHRIWAWDNMKPVSGDFNGDGKTDIAVLDRLANTGSSLKVFLSTGTRVQTPQVWWRNERWGWDGTNPLTGDFDGDGKTDFAAHGRAGGMGSNLNILRSTGTVFEPPQQWWRNIDWGWDSTKPVVDDFNGDGKCDIALWGRSAGMGTNINRFLSTGTGLAGQQQLWRNIRWGWDGIKALTGDFNGDGKADLLAVGRSGRGSNLTIFLSIDGEVQPSIWWHSHRREVARAN